MIAKKVYSLTNHLPYYPIFEPMGIKAEFHCFSISEITKRGPNLLS